MKKIFFIRVSPNFHFKNPHPQNVIIPFDIAQIISLLAKDKVACFVIDTWVENLTAQQIVKKVLAKNPSIMAITVETPVVDVAMKIFEKIKRARKDILTVAFGQHASFLPDTFLFPKSPVDVCVLGETEKTMVDLSRNPSIFKKIPGIAFFDKKKEGVIKTKPRNLINNLESLPFLAHEYFLKDDQYQALYPTNRLFGRAKWGFLLSSRGCPYNCIFCSPSIRNSWGKQFRARSPKLVFDEIEYLIKNFGVNAVDFEDDVFSLDIKRAEKICDEIIKRKIRISFAIQTRLDRLNLRLLKKLKKAGCSSITLGVESGNEEILHFTKKGITKSQIRTTVGQINKVGILMKLNFIIGFPQETLKQAEETLKFAQDLNPLYAHFHYLTPYPGTKIYQKIATNNIPFRNFSHCNLGKINLSRLSQEKYEKLLRSFYKRYYFSLRYLKKYFLFHFLNLLLHPSQYFRLLKAACLFLFQK